MGSWRLSIEGETLTISGKRFVRCWKKFCDKMGNCRKLTLKYSSTHWNKSRLNAENFLNVCEKGLWHYETMPYRNVVENCKLVEVHCRFLWGSPSFAKRRSLNDSAEHSLFFRCTDSRGIYLYCCASSNVADKNRSQLNLRNGRVKDKLPYVLTMAHQVDIRSIC